MNKQLLGLLLLAFSLNSFAGIISSIENNDDNRYNKINFELYDGGSIGTIYSSIAIQDEVTGNVTSTEFDLPVSDFLQIFSFNKAVDVKTKELSYQATGSVGNRKVIFTVNTYTQSDNLYSRSIVTLVQNLAGYSASVQVFNRVTSPRRIFYPEGLVRVATIDSQLSKAHEDGIDFYTVDGDLLGTVLSLKALYSLVNDKTVDGIQKYCETNCLRF
jgi:hypothetical protein